MRQPHKRTFKLDGIQNLDTLDVFGLLHRRRCFFNVARYEFRLLTGCKDAHNPAGIDFDCGS
jgi:hypothetical protein